MLPQTTIENKPHCEICLGKGFHVDINSNGKLFIESCSYIQDKNNINQFYFDSINRQEYNMDDPVTREKIIRRFNDKSFKDWPENIISEITLFVNNWTKYKKKQKKSLIIENPNGRRIVRNPEKHQNTVIHLFTRNQVFQIISDENRKKYTKKLTTCDDFIDISIDRDFVGWEGNTRFIISGPILCDYDQEVFDALTKIWHEKYESEWTPMHTNLREIWRFMGNNSNMGGTAIDSVKRSLERLVKCSISAKSLENKDFWIGGIIDDVAYKDDKGHKSVIVSFNKYMIQHYLNGAYATIIHPIYQKLKPFSRKLYLFTTSHKESERKMNLEKYRSPLGVNNDIEQKEFKRKMNLALKELKHYKILDPDKSIINKKNEVCTVVLEDAWNARPLHLND